MMLDNDKWCNVDLSIVEMDSERKRKLEDTEVLRGDRACFGVELTNEGALVQCHKDDVEIQLSQKLQLAIDKKR